MLNSIMSFLHFLTSNEILSNFLSLFVLNKGHIWFIFNYQPFSEIFCILSINIGQIYLIP